MRTHSAFLFLVPLTLLLACNEIVDTGPILETPKITSSSNAGAEPNTALLGSKGEYEVDIDIEGKAGTHVEGDKSERSAFERVEGTFTLDDQPLPSPPEWSVFSASVGLKNSLKFPTTAAGKTLKLSVHAIDERGLRSNEVSASLLLKPNQAPTLTIDSLRYSASSKNVSWTANADDPEGHSIETYTGEVLVGGVSIGKVAPSSSRSGSVTIAAADVGKTAEVVVTATDEFGATGTAKQSVILGP